MLFKVKSSYAQSSPGGVMPARFLLACLSLCLTLLLMGTFSAYQFLLPVWAPTAIQSPLTDSPSAVPVMTSFTPLLDVLYPFALSVLITVMITMSVAMLCVVRTNLRHHNDVIDILRLMGATQRYIAQQFQWHTFRLGFVSCLSGVSVGFGILAIGHLLTEHHIITSIPLIWNQTTVLICLSIPILGGVTGLIASHIEVSRTLHRMERPSSYH